MAKVKLFVAAVLCTLAVIIAFQNTESVDTHLLFFTVTMPRALLLLVTLLIGMAIGFFFAFRGQMKQSRKEKAKAKGKAKESEEARRAKQSGSDTGIERGQ
jgi:uncharacterized integral membrane protein